MKIIYILVFSIGFLGFSQDQITHDIYFDTDKYTLPITEQNRLLLFIKELENMEVEHISIFGYCDDRGSSNYNLELSQQRANTIKNILATNKVKDSIINNIQGKGEIVLKLIDSQDVNVIRALNRKVQIIATLKGGSSKAETKKELSVIEKIKGELNVGDKIRFDNILFETNYSYVLPESKKTLSEIAKVLKERKELYFTIEGHVCCVKNNRDALDKKTRKKNLSVARAKYIYDYFVAKGINKRRMKYVGLKGKYPLGGDEKFDRRVEIEITYVAKKN
jgi:outer membrane protein OmpA-like peptidoglycan-associated protein